MARQLTQKIIGQINNQDVKHQCIFKINGVDRTDHLISYDISFSKDFGAASAVFSLDNNTADFSIGGSHPLNVGDTIQLIEKFKDDSIEWNSFYGFIDQRSFNTSASSRTVTINCLDYIGRLQHLDIDIELEGDKFKVTNETLTPNYLTAPNDDLAQIFNFANDAVASLPVPILTITAQDGSTDDPQFDGFEILYAQGQVKLGSPLNARYNYNLKARSYYAYSRGLYAEDILESILKEPTGYNKYLFNESSAEDVVTNHLLETFYNITGEGISDTLTPNLNDEDITIYTKLTADVSSGADTVSVVSTTGFPSSGTAEINGDIFAYTSKDATHFYGVTPSGSENSIKAHPDDAYVKYTGTYEAGQVWYLSYSNVQTDLDINDFDGIDSGNFLYFDKRFGRILLDSPISIISPVLCISDYQFKTLQATGIEINAFNARSREVENRFDAISKLREFLNPNWVIYTIGDEKIWASYLTQKVNADYTLNLITAITQLEDDDLYTRVKFLGKNKNPNNIMFNDGVQFLDTGEDFTGIATQTALTLDSSDDNYYTFKTALSGIGKIVLGDVIPIVYINGQPIDNTIHVIPQAPVQVVVRTRTETETSAGGSGEPEVEVKTYYDYDIYFAHGSIVPSEPIYIYDSLGQLVQTYAPNTLYDYAGGRHLVGGGVRNTTIESFSYASYSILYSSTDLIIDYDNVKFKIAKSILPSQTTTSVTATFEYIAVFQSILDIHNVIDGRFDTQTQTIFFSEPPSDYNYAILDLGQEYDIQAIDITPGYYKPDNIRKFDIDARLTLLASTDNISYTEISSKTHNFDLATGSTVSFEEQDLGIGFSARYLKLVIEDVKKIEFGQGVWVIAFTEVAAYDNIVLEAEATLIPTTALASAIDLSGLGSSGVYPSTITVDSTINFTEPESGETATAYVEEDEFTYTGLTATQFLGVEGLSESHAIDARVSQTLAGDTTVYDDKGLIEKLGDRLFKKINISDEFLYDQTMLNRLARAYLREYVKNHDRLQVDILYAPYLRVGQTVELSNTHLGIDAENYFIESINNRSGYISIVLARYPSE